VAAETLKFRIDGVQLEMPEIDDLDMEEWQIIEHVSGIVITDFAPALNEKGKLDKQAEADRQRRVQGASFLRARLHIAYRRAHPDATDEEISEWVKTVKMVPAMEAIAEAAGELEDEGDVRPPASTLMPAASSPSENGENSGSRSTGSGESSGTPGDDLVTTGTSESGTSSPASPPKTSVV
jgi:hypothetical protein